MLHEGPAILGLLWATTGLGAMLGAFALIWWSAHARASRIWFAALAAPTGLIVLAISRQPAISLAAAGLTSFAFSSQLGLFQTMIQESTPPEFRGRVMSLFGITFNSTLPFAGLASAGLAVFAGLPFVMALSALLYAAAALSVLRFAGGGIGAVVRESRLEFDLVAAGGDGSG